MTTNSPSFWEIGTTVTTPRYSRGSCPLAIQGVLSLSLVCIRLPPLSSVSLFSNSSESGLIYFAQNSTYRPPIQGTSPSAVTSAVGLNENATLPFQPGKTYRLRIVNTSAFSAFFFWIDGHDMRIIEVDGVSFLFLEFN